ncbi:unnamed protein product [Amoebophrya sp. A25]|nr:unnamed protein product [Amoebophrya sp. A25]|eukprot:GSA25T00021483001.1
MLWHLSTWYDNLFHIQLLYRVWGFLLSRHSRNSDFLDLLTAAGKGELRYPADNPDPLPKVENVAHLATFLTYVIDAHNYIKSGQVMEETNDVNNVAKGDNSVRVGDLQLGAVREPIIPGQRVQNAMTGVWLPVWKCFESIAAKIDSVNTGTEHFRETCAKIDDIKRYQEDVADAVEAHDNKNRQVPTSLLEEAVSDFDTKMLGTYTHGPAMYGRVMEYIWEKWPQPIEMPQVMKQKYPMCQYMREVNSLAKQSCFHRKKSLTPGVVAVLKKGRPLKAKKLIDLVRKEADEKEALCHAFLDRFVGEWDRDLIVELQEEWLENNDLTEHGPDVIQRRLEKIQWAINKNHDKNDYSEGIGFRALEYYQFSNTGDRLRQIKENLDAYDLTGTSSYLSHAIAKWTILKPWVTAKQKPLLDQDAVDKLDQRIEEAGAKQLAVEVKLDKKKREEELQTSVEILKAHKKGEKATAQAEKAPAKQEALQLASAGDLQPLANGDIGGQDMVIETSKRGDNLFRLEMDDEDAQEAELDGFFHSRGMGVLPAGSTSSTTSKRNTTGDSETIGFSKRRSDLLRDFNNPGEGEDDEIEKNETAFDQSNDDQQEEQGAGDDMFDPADEFEKADEEDFAGSLSLDDFAFDNEHELQGNTPPADPAAATTGINYSSNASQHLSSTSSTVSNAVTSQARKTEGERNAQGSAVAQVKEKSPSSEQTTTKKGTKKKAQKDSQSTSTARTKKNYEWRAAGIGPQQLHTPISVFHFPWMMDDWFLSCKFSNLISTRRVVQLTYMEYCFKNGVVPKTHASENNPEGHEGEDLPVKFFAYLHELAEEAITTWSHLEDPEKRTSEIRKMFVQNMDLYWLTVAEKHLRGEMAMSEQEHKFCEKHSYFEHVCQDDELLTRLWKDGKQSSSSGNEEASGIACSTHQQETPITAPAAETAHGKSSEDAKSPSTTTTTTTINPIQDQLQLQQEQQSHSLAMNYNNLSQEPNARLQMMPELNLTTVRRNLPPIPEGAEESEGDKEGEPAGDANCEVGGSLEKDALPMTTRTNHQANVAEDVDPSAAAETPGQTKIVVEDEQEKEMCRRSGNGKGKRKGKGKGKRAKSKDSTSSQERGTGSVGSRNSLTHAKSTPKGKAKAKSGPAPKKRGRKAKGGEQSEPMGIFALVNKSKKQQDQEREQEHAAVDEEDHPPAKKQKTTSKDKTTPPANRGSSSSSKHATVEEEVEEEGIIPSSFNDRILLRRASARGSTDQTANQQAQVSEEKNAMLEADEANQEEEDDEEDEPMYGEDSMPDRLRQEDEESGIPDKMW